MFSPKYSLTWFYCITIIFSSLFLISTRFLGDTDGGFYAHAPDTQDLARRRCAPNVAEWTDSDSHDEHFPRITPCINFKSTLYHTFCLVWINLLLLSSFFFNGWHQYIRKCLVTTIGILENWVKKEKSGNWKPKSIQLGGFVLFCFFNEARQILHV